MLIRYCGNNDERLGSSIIVIKGEACKYENEYGAKDEGTYSVDGSATVIKLSKWETDNKYQFKVDGGKLSLVDDGENYRPSYELEKK